jgi:hypothetical protein
MRVRIPSPAPSFIRLLLQFAVIDEMGKFESIKARQLGVSPSAAMAKLVRMFLFQTLSRLNENVCFRCGKVIERLMELSIDHKEPWLHVDPKLFWDLSNVAVSHKACNSGARRSRPRLYKAGRKEWKASFALMYSDPIKRDKWNARRRELYKFKMAHSSTG